MKKLLIILMAFILLCMVGCAKEEEESGEVSEVVTPKSEVITEVGDPEKWIYVDATEDKDSLTELTGITGIEKVTTINISENNKQEYSLIEFDSAESTQKALDIYKQILRDGDVVSGAKENADSLTVPCGKSIELVSRKDNTLLVVEGCETWNGVDNKEDEKKQIINVVNTLGYPLPE